jgi:hypothetical protein
VLASYLDRQGLRLAPPSFVTISFASNLFVLYLPRLNFERQTIHKELAHSRQMENRSRLHLLDLSRRARGT